MIGQYKCQKLQQLILRHNGPLEYEIISYSVAERGGLQPVGLQLLQN